MKVKVWKHVHICGLTYRSRYTNLLRAERSRDQSRWMRGFPHPARPALETIQTPEHRKSSFPGGKEAGAWR